MTAPGESVSEQRLTTRRDHHAADRRAPDDGGRHPLLEAVLASGFRSIRLDVAATNYRAVRCYEQCGMRIVEEFWQNGEGPDDPNEAKWAPLMPHLRREGDQWFVRFYWMEITAP
jgi:hypothetical protein